MEQGVLMMISLVICTNIRELHTSCNIIQERELIISNTINFEFRCLGLQIKVSYAIKHIKL